MAFDNPFLDSAGHIKFPEDGSIVGHVEGFAQSQGESLAYRFLDFSTGVMARISTSRGRSSVRVTVRWRRVCSR